MGLKTIVPASRWPAGIEFAANPVVFFGADFSSQFLGPCMNQ